MPALDFAIADPARLASALRGKAVTKNDTVSLLPAGKTDIVSVLVTPLLPHALATWERDRPAREAEALRIATTPRAQIGGEKVERPISNVPTVEHRVSKLVADLTPSNEPTPDTGG